MLLTTSKLTPTSTGEHVCCATAKNGLQGPAPSNEALEPVSSVLVVTALPDALHCSVLFAETGFGSLQDDLSGRQRWIIAPQAGGGYSITTSGGRSGCNTVMGGVACGISNAVNFNPVRSDNMLPAL